MSEKEKEKEKKLIVTIASLEEDEIIDGDANGNLFIRKRGEGE